MWVRGLKLIHTLYNFVVVMSHPMWVRGLKLEADCRTDCRVVSHPMWVRGLKHLCIVSKWL